MKHILLSFLIAASASAENIVTKYNGLFMPVSKATPNLLYLKLEGKTYSEKPEEAEKLHDSDFIQCIRETKSKSIYEISAKGGVLTHKAIASLMGQQELRKLNLARNKSIDDEAMKKIVMYLPRLEMLNLYGTSVTNEGLTHLLDLQQLRSLHLFDTKVTWSAANEFRSKMESISGNDDLSITTGHGNPALGSIKHSKFLKETYQKNVALGRLDPNFSDKYPEIEAVKGDENKYEEDLKKESTEPIFKEDEELP